jgi:uncharacterized protein
MKLLTVADIVTQRLLETEAGKPFIPNVDLIISCGDLPPEFLTALRHRYDVPLYYVLGNHDIRYTATPPIGCTCIDRRLLVYKNIRILGFSGSRWYNGGMNQYTEVQMASFIRKMIFQLWRHRGVDLVVSHASPRYIHDTEDNCHKGFRSFRQMIDRYHPRYFVHGHIHVLFDNDSERMTVIDSTRVINSYGYATIEI